VDGDASCYSIACASIVAKVVRDRLMRRLAARYPGYGWEHNAGYATADHREALQRLGPTPFHRRSFAPVQVALNGLQMDLPLGVEAVVDLEAEFATELAELIEEARLAPTSSDAG